MKKVICVAAAGILLTTILFGCSKSKETVALPETAYSILQITDIHILNDEKKDKKVMKSITSMIEKTNPNFIMVTGDITSEHDNLTAIQKFGTFIEKFKIPWDFTYGNHDAEGQASKDEIDAYLDTLEYCTYERGDPEVYGHGNHYRNVTDDQGKVLTSLIMMDSNMYDEENEGYDHFHDSQIQWYSDTVKQIAMDVNGSEDKVVPSLAFFHIPMQEYVTAYDEAKKTDNRLSGFRFEKSGSPAVDDQMFETMLSLGSTKGVFVGHDHMNDYTVMYKGIRLSYGNSSDHNIYLVPMRGGNLIEIKKDGSFTTSQVFVHRLFGNVQIKNAK